MSGFTSGRKQGKHVFPKKGMTVADSKAGPGGIEKLFQKEDLKIFESRFLPPGQYFPYCFPDIEYQNLWQARDIAEHTHDR